MITILIGAPWPSTNASQLQLERIRATLAEALQDVPFTINPLPLVSGIFIGATREHAEHIPLVCGIVAQALSS
jgi:hypothetical protein